jgi:predicted DNA-binding transcriptional regulator YafY
VARGDQALRQWKILTTIMSHARYGVTQQQLLDDLRELLPRGKGKRTLQRDIQVLERAGFPIDRTSHAENGQVLYKFLPGFQQIPPIMPTVQELIGLAVAHSLLTMYEGTPFKESLDTFWQKAQAIFPDDARELLADAQSLFDTLDRPAMDFRQHKPILTTLNAAIKDRRRLKMTYYSRRQGKESDYTIDPLMLFTYGGLLYLVAYTHNYKEIRHFALDKMKRLTPTSLRFSPRHYSLDNLKSQAFGIVQEEPFDLVVRFDKEIALQIKRRIHHPTQRIEVQPDGDLILRLRAGGWDEMKAWLFSYSHRAEVLEPKKMRKEIKAELGRLMERYATE